MKRLETRAAHFFQIKCDFEESGIKWVFGSDTEIFPEKDRPVLTDSTLRIAA